MLYLLLELYQFSLGVFHRLSLQYVFHIQPSPHSALCKLGFPTISVLLKLAIGKKFYPSWHSFPLKHYVFLPLCVFSQRYLIFKFSATVRKLGRSYLAINASSSSSYGFSTPVAGLPLFKNLLLSTYHLFFDIVWPAYTSFGQGQNFVQKNWVNGIFSLGPDGSTISLCIVLSSFSMSSLKSSF